jgi:putative transposase
MTVAFDDLRGAGVATRTACSLTGRARASHYSRLRPLAVRRPPIPQSKRRAPTQALSPAERTAVLGVLNTVGNADLSIGQVWVRELDEGRYWCSLSSMYRIAAAAGQTRERRAQDTHPAKVKPELLADALSQVWSWGITKLRGPAKGVWFHLYVLIDIYSRYNPGWIVAACEDSVLAKDFLDEAVTRNGTVPHTVQPTGGPR